MQCQSVAIRGQSGLQPIPYLFLMSLRIKGLSKGVLVSAIQNDLVPTFYIDCCSNVIMSGWGDDNPDDEGREAARGSTKSVSRGADGGRGSHGSRSKRAAVLPDQSSGNQARVWSMAIVVGPVSTRRRRKQLSTLWS